MESGTNRGRLRRRRHRCCCLAEAGAPDPCSSRASLPQNIPPLTANAGLSAVVVDPAYSSRWGALHWLASLREHHPQLSGHHAAALVLGRRGLGHRARRRATGNRTAPADAVRPAQARTRKPPNAKTAPRKPDAPRDTRQPPGSKTGKPHRTTAGNQATEDRSQPPAEPTPTITRCQGTVSCQVRLRIEGAARTARVPKTAQAAPKPSTARAPTAAATGPAAIKARGPNA
jgi:hypothetical protein